MKPSYPALKIGRLFSILAFSVLTMLPMSASANDIFYANNNLTFREFIGAFKGNDKQLKRDANVYLYGVIDATEKKYWCSFWGVKSAELISSFHGLFDKKVSESRYDERASHIITELLQTDMPCKKEKS